MPRAGFEPKIPASSDRRLTPQTARPLGSAFALLIRRINKITAKYKYILFIKFNTKFLHLVVCLTTGPKPLPKRVLHIVRSRASSFKWEYPLLSLRSSSTFLRLLPRLPVTSIPSFIFPSITRCRRQFLRKMWPIPTCCTICFIIG